MPDPDLPPEKESDLALASETVDAPAAEIRPWETLTALTEARNSGDLEDFLETLSPGETARAMARLDEATRTQMLSLIDPAEAADLLDDLSIEQAVDLIEEMEPSEAAGIFGELPADEQADILGDLSSRDAEAILDKMSIEDATKARALMEHDDESAGGLMIAEFLSFRQDLTSDDVLADLRGNRDEYSDYEVQYAYVTDDAGCLVGVLRLRDLMLSARNLPIRKMMIPEPMSVPVD